MDRDEIEREVRKQHEASGGLDGTVYHLDVDCSSEEEMDRVRCEFAEAVMRAGMDSEGSMIEPDEMAGPDVSLDIRATGMVAIGAIVALAAALALAFTLIVRG